MKIRYIYTDGSHFKGKGGSGRLGIGGVIVDPTIGPDGKMLSKFSIEILPEFMKLHYGTADTSNPTMEILAALQALDEFKSEIDQDTRIIMRQDYLGVSSWMTGKWKITKPYIRKIKEEIDKTIRDRFLTVEWEWVKGHQKATTTEAYWNSVVDLLAKGEG